MNRQEGSSMFGDDRAPSRNGGYRQRLETWRHHGRAMALKLVPSARRVAEQPRQRQGARQHAPLRRVNRFLWGLAVSATVLAPFFVWYDGSKLTEILIVPANTRIHDRQKPQAANDTKPSFATIAARRRYFRHAKIRTSAPASPVRLDASQAPGLAARYTLLGIVRGQAPQAIVRENSTQTSMFLSEGQSLAGYTVREILPNRIILSHEGQEFELRM